MIDIKKYSVKIWYTNTRPLMKLPDEIMVDSKIKKDDKVVLNLEEPLLLIVKNKSIEIFNSEIPTIQ